VEETEADEKGINDVFTIVGSIRTENAETRIKTTTEEGLGDNQRGGVRTQRGDVTTNECAGKRNS